MSEPQSQPVAVEEPLDRAALGNPQLAIDHRQWYGSVGEVKPRRAGAQPTEAFSTGHFCLGTGRRGFTLVELVVSMGILVGLMAMVGMIFSLATSAASVGTANMSVRRMLRVAREIIERDLEALDPTEGALAVYGWEQLAYASLEDRSSGRSVAGTRRDPNGDQELDYRPPFDYRRADVLLLITRAQVAPYAVDAPGLEGTGQMVVYGHADLGELLSRDSLDPADHEWEDGDLFRRIENGRLAVDSLGIVVGDHPSALPSSRWHLARRSTVFVERDTTDAQAIGNWIGTPYRLAAASTRDRIYRAGADDTLGNGRPGGDLLDEFDIDEALSVWAVSPEGIPDDWYYPDINRPDRRTVLDLTPPPGQQGRLAYQFLPGCVEFKVEVTFDDPSMVFDRTPADGFVDLQAAVNWFTVPSGRRLEWVRGRAVELNDARNQNATQAASDPSWRNALGRAYGGGIFEQRLVGGMPPDPRDPPFPTALRITLRVMDRNESLYRPRFQPSRLDPDTEEMASDGAITEMIVHNF